MLDARFAGFSAGWPSALHCAVEALRCRVPHEGTRGLSCSLVSSPI